MNSYRETLWNHLLTWLPRSADDLALAIRGVPMERWQQKPPGPLGEWPAHQHVWHLMAYERDVGLPSMLYLLSGDAKLLQPSSEFGERAPYSGFENLEDMLNTLRAVKGRQHQLLESGSLPQWETLRFHPYYDSGVSALWMLGKGYQHTLEHLTTLWQIALFWDMYSQT